MFYVDIFLYTQMDDDGKLRAVRYNLEQEDLNILTEAIRKGQQLLPLTGNFHNIDDVIRLSFYKVDKEEKIK